MRAALLLFVWAFFHSVCATRLHRSIIVRGSPLVRLRHSLNWEVSKDSTLRVLPTFDSVVVRNDHYWVRIKLHSENTLTALQVGCCVGVFRDGMLLKDVEAVKADDRIVVFMSRETLSDELASRPMLRSQIEAFAANGLAERNPYGDFVTWTIDATTE